MEGVTAISNYISTQDKTIGGRTVPSGSWIKELMITNPDIIEMIKSNEVNGVSPNFRLHANSTCLKELEDIEGNLFYNKDIENKECMKPIFLSLVDEPSNEFGLEVFSYDKYLEKSKKPKIGGKNMANKFKEMLKGFGESIVSYADEMDDTEPENDKENDVELNKADNDTSESAPSETPPVEESTSSDGNVLSEENSFEEIENKVRNAVQEKYFPEDEKGYKNYIGLALTFSDAVVIQNWDDDKYYKCDYSIDGDTVTLGELQEVELKYVVKGTEEETPAETTTEEVPVEAQKSKQPKIKIPKLKINEEKLDDVELEKQSNEKVNHLGFPIKTTKELSKSKNSFNF